MEEQFTFSEWLEVVEKMRRKYEIVRVAAARAENTLMAGLNATVARDGAASILSEALKEATRIG